MKGSRIVGTCSYCGVVAQLSDDHIPPRSLFSKPRPSNLITVPACDACNGGAGKDDEYFRIAITAGIRPDLFPGESTLSQRAIAALGRPEAAGFARLIASQVREVALHTPSGLFVRRALSLQPDQERVNRVLSRITRGLLWHRTQTPLPSNYAVTVFYVGDRFEALEPQCAEAFGATELHVIGEHVFTYRCRQTDPDPHCSIWLYHFFDRHSFFAVTLPEA